MVRDNARDDEGPGIHIPGSLNGAHNLRYGAMSVVFSLTINH